MNAEISSKNGWGGARPNSGGARPNAGGARPGAGRPRRAATPGSASAPAVGAPTWVCVRTQSGAEITVDLALRQAGFPVFHPRLWRPPIPARRDRRGAMRPARSERIVPLFPRYLFVEIRLGDTAWISILHTRGVDGIVGFAGVGAPPAVPGRQLDWVRSILAPNDCLYPDGHDGQRYRPRIQPGTELRVVDGALEGSVGIAEWSDARRVRLLMTIMGGSVPVTVPVAAVEPTGHLARAT